MKLLLFSTLYPSSARPGHGQFVEARLRELLKQPGIEARVVAPVPWFWSGDARWGDYARFALTPRAEQRHGIAITHPRYPLLPKVGMTLAPLLLAAACLPHLRRLRAEGFDFDVIDAHYFYPDGVAAALLGRWLDRPVTITARGSDLNVIGDYPLQRRMMRWAAESSAGSIGVCQALVDVLAGWGVPPDKLHVMRNGVDLQRFRPEPPLVARQRLGLKGAPLLLCVANLLPVKDHALLLRALPLVRQQHPQLRLVLAGQGPLRDELKALAAELGLADAVQFAGSVPNDQLAGWYSAADVSVLASRSEGWANVLLESMACGTPVVATDVGGLGEVIRDPRAGALVPERSPESLAATLLKVLAERPPREQVRRYAEDFSWDATSQAQQRLFSRVVRA